MVKILLLITLFLGILEASTFKENCLSCHENDFKFTLIIKKYTQKYSSEKKIKEAMFEYLREPTIEKAILPYEYINRFGIKDKSNLDDKTLRDMIDIYYKEFNMKDDIY
ncbi:MAG TPA: hypothetical protein VLZ29_09700 [Sulfurimonas sp.]|uniref:hypothetical protein n=1 Tax=Sulfurimonas sp. TaxID=2022749 RepID=UPI002BF6944D|nr:hypothetical protein [Sulfurimonas sp.]HUH43383.1 hypothetical protein [Sulfurimonas sp.]